MQSSRYMRGMVDLQFGETGLITVVQPGHGLMHRVGDCGGMGGQGARNWTIVHHVYRAGKQQTKRRDA